MSPRIVRRIMQIGCSGAVWLLVLLSLATGCDTPPPVVPKPESAPEPTPPPPRCSLPPAPEGKYRFCIPEDGGTARAPHGTAGAMPAINGELAIPGLLRSKAL